MAEEITSQNRQVDFSNKTVAILGASSKRERYSNKAVRALIEKAKGAFPIHPTEGDIEGLKTYPNVESIPVRPDILTVYLSQENFLCLLDDVEKKGSGEIWLNPGADSDKVVRELLKRNLPFKKTCTIIEAGFHPSEL